MPKGDYAKLKADIEDGVVPIAHLLLEALSMAKLNGVAKGLVLFIWRRTYGWSEEGKRKHKDDRITLAEFATAVSSERTYVSTQLKLLVKAQVIFERSDPDNGRYKRYGMNTEIANWSSNVMDVDKLVEAVNAKLYVHSSRKVLQMDNGLVNTQPFANTQPLSNDSTKPLCKSTTVVVDNPLPGAGSEPSKESIERKISAADKEYAHALNDLDDEVAEREVEIRMQVRTNNFNYRLIDKDYSTYKQLRTEGVDLQFILDGIDEAFNAYVQKHSMDAITKFSYCAKRILDRWTGEQSKKSIATQARAGPTHIHRNQNRGGVSNESDDEWARIGANFFNRKRG